MPKFTPIDFDPFEQGEGDSAFLATASQREVWLGAWIGGADANRAFNEGLVLQLDGPLDRRAMFVAYERLVRQHDALRTTFSRDGEWCFVARAAPTRLQWEDLAAREWAHQRAEIERMRAAAVTLEFDLHRGPLHCATLVRLEHHRHLFIFSAHHIVCDWWSAGVLMQDVARFYREQAEGTSQREPPGSAVPFIRYAEQQLERERGRVGERDRQFWLGSLADYEGRWALPTDRPRQKTRSYASRRLDITWGEESRSQTVDIARRHACTATTCWLALVQVWLKGITGADDIVVGVPSAGQVVHGEPQLVGHCVHLLPIRLRCALGESFSAVVQRAKATMLACVDHTEVTYSALLAALPRLRQPGQLPLVTFSLNVDKGLPRLDFGDIEVRYETIPRRYENFEISMNVVLGAPLTLQFNFNTYLFEERTLRRWAQQLRDLVGRVASAPESTVASLIDASSLLVDQTGDQT